MSSTVFPLNFSGIVAGVTFSTVSPVASASNWAKSLAVLSVVIRNNPQLRQRF